MEKNQFVITIIVALVVAVIASLLTVGLTGNIIKVTPVVNGTQVYTKTEIDAKFSNINAHDCKADDLCRVFAIYGDAAGGRVILKNYVTVSGMALGNVSSNQTGNGYVCVDKLGQFYRGASYCK